MATWEKLLYEKVTSALATDHSYSGRIVELECNSGVLFGDVCRINSSGYAVFADSSALANSFALFMALEAIDPDEVPQTIKFLMPNSFVRDDSWSWVKGSPIYLSTSGTAGSTLTQTAPTGNNNVVQIVGMANSLTVMMFYPMLVQVVYKVS